MHQLVRDARVKLRLVAEKKTTTINENKIKINASKQKQILKITNEHVIQKKILQQILENFTDFLKIDSKPKIP
jgi:hypothetical protein